MNHFYKGANVRLTIIPCVVFIICNAVFSQNSSENAEVTGSEKLPLQSSLDQTPEQKQLAMKILRDDILAGKALAGTGAAINMIGAGLWVIGVATGFGADNRQEAKSSITLRIIGGITMAIGPIPACAGSMKVKNSMQDLLGRPTSLPYWGEYGQGWALVLLGQGVALGGSLLAINSNSQVVYIISNITGLVVSLFGEVEWAKAAFGSLNYVNRIDKREKTGRLNFSLSPKVSGNGEYGLVLNCKLK
jgi:uncharacterized membrane protein